MRLLKRVLLGILVLVAAFILFLAGSIALDYAVGADRLDTVANVTIPGTGEAPDVDSGRIAIAGFCYGGRTSLGYSLHNNQLAATVIFYGSPETDPAVLKSLPG